MTRTGDCVSVVATICFATMFVAAANPRHENSVPRCELQPMVDVKEGRTGVGVQVEDDDFLAGSAGDGVPGDMSAEYARELT